MKQPQDHTSPRWIRSLLNRLLDKKTAEASLGDLEEKFQQRMHSSMSRRRAVLLYILEAFGFLRMTRTKDIASVQTDINMINHTLVFFARLARRDSGYYLLSVLGLALSLVSFMLVMMFIRDELSYDQFHTEKGRIYRVTTHLKLSDVEYNLATTAFPAAGVIQSDIEGIEHAIRIHRQQRSFEWGEKKFDEQVVLADDKFFDVFTFPFLKGDRAKALSNPASVILTEKTAVKYFGTIEAVGKTLKLDEHVLEVTGVVKDVPEQSHLKFDVIMPLAFQLAVWKSETGIEGRENKWFWIGAYTYLLLQPDAKASVVEEKLASIVQNYFPERYQEHGKLKLQSLTDIHFVSNLSNEAEPGGNKMYVRLFSVVAFVIMMVSAINLINLSWFKISARIRELGIRKFLGQNGARIIAQLCLESMLLGLTAFLISIVLSLYVIPYFNLLVEKNLDVWSPANVQLIIFTGILIFFISIVAVIKPATRYAFAPGYWMMQRYTSAGTVRLRNALMGMQVGFSFVLLVFTFIVGSQLDFFQHKDLGFDRDNVIAVELNEDFWTHQDAFRDELLKSGDILYVAGGKVPGTGYDSWRFVPEDGSYEKPLLMPLAWVDHGYLATLNIKLLTGENFQPDKTYDSLWPFLINKKAAIELGWLDDPLNKTMELFAPGTTDIMAKGIVIGVMDDYHFESLHRPVKPAVLTITDGYGTALIKVSGNAHGKAMGHIAETWKKFSDKPFVYEAVDEKLNKLYANEARLSNIMLFFTFVALYLTCYGMFAMSSLLFSSRLKEVAIRKVFGAGQYAIIKQFYSRYALFNGVAILAGLPVAIYVGNLWLQTFQYRIELGPAFFIKAGACIIIAGLLSVSYYLARLTVSNPVKFLRRE